MPAPGGAENRRGWLFASWRGWTPAWLPADVLAGLLLAAIALPEQLATARLAGLPAQAGLVAFLAGSLGFALLGANRVVSVGADSTIAPIFAGGLAALAVAGLPPYPQLAALLALMAGAVLILAALLRAGWIADLLSIPVTTGLLAGIAVHIVVGQLPALFGIAEPAGTLPARLLRIAAAVPGLNPFALAIGLGTAAAMLAAERWMPHLPGALLAVLAAAGVVAAFGLRGQGVAMLAALPPGMPYPHPPALPTLAVMLRLMPLALVVALVCMVQTAAVVRAFAGPGETLVPVGPDFAGVGAGSILSGLFGAFAVDASPPRTAAVVAAGGRSQVASLVAVGCALALMLRGGSLLAAVPQAALAGILLAIAVRITRIGEMLRILRRGGTEILLVAAAAALVVFLPIEAGMLAAVALSLMQSFYGLARPQCVELARAPGSTVWWPPDGEERGEQVPGVLVFAPAAPLNFTNIVYICRRLNAAVAAARPPVGLVVLEASGVVGIDYTAARILLAEVAALRGRGIAVALARLSAERAQQDARRTGLLAGIGADWVFRSAEQAVQDGSRRALSAPTSRADR